MKRRMEISQHCWKFIYKHSDINIFVPSHVQGLEMITFIFYNPWLQTSILLISDYLENLVLEVLSKFSTSQNTANIYGTGAVSY